MNSDEVLNASEGRLSTVAHVEPVHVGGRRTELDLAEAGGRWLHVERLHAEGRRTVAVSVSPAGFTY